MNKKDENGKKQGYWELLVGPNFFTRGYTLTLKGTYVDNALDGEYTYYYNNGNVESSGVCKDGAYDGEVKFFYHNGKLRHVGSYIPQFYSKGKRSRPETKVGVHIAYDRIGNESARYEYKDGELIKKDTEFYEI